VDLLRVARRLLLLTLVEYDFGVVAALTGIQAMKATSVITFAGLIKMAAAGSLLSAEAIDVIGCRPAATQSLHASA